MRPRGRAVPVVVLAVFLPAVVLAHASPPDLSLFGPFGAGSVRCLAGVSRTAQRCFHRVLGLRRWCAEPSLGGRPCDPETRAREIEAALGRTAAVVPRACTAGQLTELRLGAPADASGDARRACEAAESAFTILSPAVVDGGGTQTAPATGRTCARRVSSTGHKFLRQLVRLKNRALARMAAVYVAPSQKRARLAAVEARIARLRAKVDEQVTADCPQFEAEYGRPLLDFERALQSVADCVVGSTYVQTAISCR